jgi:hypothetical protein
MTTRSFALFSPNPEQTGRKVLAWSFLLVQLLALILIADRYELEADLHLRELLMVLTGGFLIQPFIPGTYRVHYFVGLSLVGLVIFTGPVNALWVVAIGSLITLAARYLPRGPLQYGTLLALAGTLAALVALRPAWSLPHALAWSTLGSMFLFRLSIYLYEQPHRKTRTTLIQDLAYFFMLPNMALLLFPAVDQSAFLKRDPDGQDWQTWKKGVQWLALGVFHLVLYRVFYFYLLTPVSEVRDLLGFAQYALFNYGLIIRLSGIFHIAVGALCLFGFSLPPVFNNYFLATGFSDLWRRINIYFREYLVKVFYYPIYFRLRGRGPGFAVPVTILILFLLTWLLHSFQWFWLKGQFPLRVVDALFWGIFGILVAGNALLEMRRGRTAGSESPWRRSALRAFRIGGMLVFMSLLWSLWSAPGLAEWLVPLRAALGSPGEQFLLLALILLAGLLAGTLILRISDRFHLDAFFNPPPPGARASFWSLAMLGSLLVLQWGPLQEGLKRGGIDLSGMLQPRLTEADERLRIEGYYSEILIGNELTSPLAGIGREAEDRFQESDGKRLTGDFRHIAKEPNTSFLFKGKPFSVNRWGMRDRDYALEPASGTLRVLLLGGSFVVGSGVGDEEVFDQHLERRMNAGSARYEFLNFGTASYDLIDVILQFDLEELHRFRPDYLFFFSHGIDGPKTLMDIARNLKAGTEMPYPFLPIINYKAGVNREMTLEEIAQKLEPFTAEVLEESYRLLAERCATYGIEPVWVYWPPIARREASGSEKEDVKALVSRWGFRVLDLEGIYDTYEEKALTVSRFDMHPNALGHRVFADALYEIFHSEFPLVKTSQD